jgi:hypothetical protein
MNPYRLSEGTLTEPSLFTQGEQTFGKGHDAPTSIGE